MSTVAFRILYCFVVLRLDWRRIVHFNVTTNPTATWAAQQIIDAFPFDEAPKYLIRDRDGIYGEYFQQRVKHMGIKEVLISLRSPWQNPNSHHLLIALDVLDAVLLRSKVGVSRPYDSGRGFRERQGLGAQARTGNNELPHMGVGGMLMVSRRFTLITFGALGNVCCLGCAGSDAGLHRFEYREMIMGVQSRIVLYAEDHESARRGARAAFDRMAELDSVMSACRPDSELTEVCRAPGEKVRVSEDLFRVLRRAQEISVASEGAFDVTIGPLVRVWREAQTTGRLPAESRLEEARQQVGRQHLVLDSDARTVQLAQPGMQLDLGGIGKGFAADEALRELTRRGIARYLVDVGGDLAVGDPPPDRDGWRIAIEAAPAWRGELAVVIDNAAIATSGGAYQSVQINGARYSHLVDPRTGLGLNAGISVTVVARDAATADALASAISVLGAEQGFKLLEHFEGSSALIVHHDGEEQWQVWSAEFPIDPDRPPGGELPVKVR